MRGKACTRRVTIPSGRITPAYAGKSASPPQKGQGFRDHPRLCGEKICRAAPLSGLPGSPPPMRGKGSKPKICLASTGITPAYAGKSALYTDYKPLHKDHPRLCGEKLPCPRLIQRHSGSPPPMRGKAFQKQIPVHDTGITPAYAGKSDVIAATFGTIQDHPRLCGEKFDMMKATGKVKGSPPPMRGKDSVTLYPDHVVRITPAYAGKSRY